MRLDRLRPPPRRSAPPPPPPSFANLARRWALPLSLPSALLPTLSAASAAVASTGFALLVFSRRRHGQPGLIDDRLQQQLDRRVVAGQRLEHVDGPAERRSGARVDVTQQQLPALDVVVLVELEHLGLELGQS